MVIDVHAHYYPIEYLDFLGRSDLPPRPAAPLASQTLSERMELLSETGIDCQVLSISQAQPYLQDAKKACEAARLVNFLYVDMCQRHPTRFRMFTALPLPHVDFAIAELERMAEVRESVGITLGCTINGAPLDDVRFDPLFSELNRRKSVVFLHPMGREDLEWLADYNLAWMVGAPFEDTVAAIRLVASGMVERYPGIRFIIPHLGGTLPFLAARIMRKNTLGERLGDGLRRLYYDTVSLSVSSLQSALETFGQRQLLFGTDYPYCNDEEFRRHLSYLTEASLSPDDLEAVQGTNAANLLKI